MVEAVPQDGAGALIEEEKEEAKVENSGKDSSIPQVANETLEVSNKVVPNLRKQLERLSVELPMHHWQSLTKFLEKNKLLESVEKASKVANERAEGQNKAKPKLLK